MSEGKSNGEGNGFATAARKEGDRGVVVRHAPRKF